MSIRLAVLDMAGTTVRDDGAVERAFAESIGEMGLDPEPHLALVRETMGQSKIVVFRQILGDDQRAEEANRRFEAAYDAAIDRGEAVPLPGAGDTLGALRATGVKVCLTTGFSASTQQHLLDALSWHDLVDLALVPGNGLRGRPYPDLVFAAIMRLGIDGVQDVAVAGDTVNDLLAGHRAGASIVAGVCSGAHPRELLATAPHTHLLDAIAELLPLVGEE